MAIVKVLSRHSPSYASLAGYILRYIANDQKTGQVRVYTSNLRSDSIAGYVSEFVENESFRRVDRSDAVRIYHEIVGFGDEDRKYLTEEVVDDLAREYMRLRGETGVMLGMAHYDQDHVHLHFCVSALHYRTGWSFGMSNAQMRELKERFQEYHRLKYPELASSLPEHGRGESYARPERWHALRREQVVEQVRQCYARAASQQDFLALLRDAGLHHYERNGDGVATGVEYQGQKFRFSRLLEDGMQLADLPIERSEEDRALEAIRAVRERQIERDGRDRDTEDRER
ncbi:relaxase/mobilization nuclease domain-containing protein [Mucilaginibacter mali]|uniref:Relaxase/mobilization nuclease domain-containing protein n=1 Tax=Mucilaginibacter mali TaxID=2740462 RepID=A0A7D4QF60_9SPHI|nr:relaxase/mobilization nuclease domain-containing protein [Mucilaginibacter mali]QKJ32464.1 relaxase/mobilization nuclease domain-containing protein [Mucilaginibacter mali]